MSLLLAILIVVSCFFYLGTVVCMYTHEHKVGERYESIMDLIYDFRYFRNLSRTIVAVTAWAWLPTVVLVEWTWKGIVQDLNPDDSE